jgi:acetyl-CoA carboxylase carboxyl transferase subunit beta
MNWLSDVVRPRIKTFFKREMPDKLWIKCPTTGQMTFLKDVESNLFVIPESDHHLRMRSTERLRITLDDGKWETCHIDTSTLLNDPLKFRDEKKYADRLREARSRTGLEDAVLVGFGKLKGLPVTVGVHDSHFMMGSLSIAVGETLIKGMFEAAKRKTPFILFSASGGARMQEGIFSLMQMPRVTLGVRKLREAKVPYIVVLTDPTMGGVTASYAMLGDIHIAEPSALIGFAGPRVIEQTMRQSLPNGFQKAEYLKEHGMVDMVVHRRDMRDTLSQLCHVLTHTLPSASS